MAVMADSEKIARLRGALQRLIDLACQMDDAARGEYIHEYSPSDEENIRVLSEPRDEIIIDAQAALRETADESDDLRATKGTP